MSEIVFIDGDFRSGQGDCRYHCSPSVHPMQIGPEWVYGCTHKAWPANKHGDFCPIVDCSGVKTNCDLPAKLLGNYKRGLKVRIKNAEKKILRWQGLLEEAENLA